MPLYIPATLFFYSVMTFALVWSSSHFFPHCDYSNVFPSTSNLNTALLFLFSFFPFSFCGKLPKFPPAFLLSAISSSASIHLFWICTLLIFSIHGTTFLQLPYLLYSVLNLLLPSIYSGLYLGFRLWPILSPSHLISLTSHSADYTNCFKSFSNKPYWAATYHIPVLI